MDIFYNFFYIPVFNLLMFLYTLFSSNIGLAIIGLAVFSRIITIPLTRNQKQNTGKANIMQQKMKEIRKKYKHNQEKMTQELAKLQAEFLPGQLKGCFSLILSLILLIQVRNVVVDLIDKGAHAYNVVAYSESLKKPEDSITFKPAEEFSLGQHTIKLNLTADNGNKLEKIYTFEVVENKDKSIEQIKQAELAKPADERKTESDALAKQLEAERASDIAVFNEAMTKAQVNVPLSSFLIFTTESYTTHLLTDRQPDLVFYIRPPSNHKIVAGDTKIAVDGKEVTSLAKIQAGDSLNLDFLGMNLSRVASDYSSSSFTVVLPYIVLAVLVGITQYFVSKIYSSLTPSTAAPEEKKPVKDEEKKDKKDKKKKKHEEEEEPDFSQMMGQSMKNMNYLFPVMTTMMSLGYLGGASLFPSGVSLFWTGQNAFVIIQQVLDDRKKIVLQIREKLVKFKSKFFPTKSLPEEKAKS